MKYLLLNRHAKSSWQSSHALDHDRELDPVGVSDATMMGKRLYEKGISFDLMLTSTAIRAITTCHLMASEIGYSVEDIQLDRNIYGADINTLKDIISSTNDEKVESLAVFGHNPTFHSLAIEILSEEINKFHACGMLYVQFNTDRWSNCFNSDKEVIFYDSPKEDK